MTLSASFTKDNMRFSVSNEICLHRWQKVRDISVTGGSLTLLCSKKNMKGDKIKIIYILLNKIIFHFSVFLVKYCFWLTNVLLVKQSLITGHLYSKAYWWKVVHCSKITKLPDDLLLRIFLLLFILMIITNWLKVLIKKITICLYTHCIRYGGWHLLWLCCTFYKSLSYVSTITSSHTM